MRLEVLVGDDDFESLITGLRAKDFGGDAF